MENFDKIIMNLPLEEIVDSRGITLKRIKYLDINEIKDILKSENLQLFIADIGKPLIWIEENIFDFWKSEIKKHIANTEKFNLEDFENNYAYIASLWDENPSIILLEKYH